MRKSRPHAAASPLHVVERRSRYRLRLLAALAGTLVLILAATHLPLYEAPRAVGWFVAPFELLTLDVVDVQEEADGSSRAAADVPPQTLYPQPAQDEVEPVETPGRDEAQEAAPAPPPERVPGRTLFAHRDVASHIVGGIGAYYIHIEYPIEAIRANIQGRLMLRFTIDEDGRATDVDVAKSLHPLCDSAAVAALHQTRFIPAREANGEAVPIRVKLPVRFRIETPPTVAESGDLQDG